MIQRKGFREDAAGILLIAVAGAFLALFGIHDAIDTPFHAGLGWAVKLTSGAGFNGRAACERVAAATLAKMLVGFTTVVMSDQRYRVIDRNRSQAFYADRPVPSRRLRRRAEREAAGA